MNKNPGIWKIENQPSYFNDVMKDEKRGKVAFLKNAFMNWILRIS